MFLNDKVKNTGLPLPEAHEGREINLWAAHFPSLFFLSSPPLSKLNKKARKSLGLPTPLAFLALFQKLQNRKNYNFML